MQVTWHGPKIQAHSHPCYTQQQNKLHKTIHVLLCGRIALMFLFRYFKITKPTLRIKSLLLALYVSCEFYTNIFNSLLFNPIKPASGPRAMLWSFALFDKSPKPCIASNASNFQPLLLGLVSHTLLWRDPNSMGPQPKTNTKWGWFLLPVSSLTNNFPHGL